MKRMVVCGSLVALFAMSVSGQLIENFESYAEGSNPGDFGDGVTITADTEGNGTLVLQQKITDDSTFTGAGVLITPELDSSRPVIRFDAYFSSTYNGAIGVSAEDGVSGSDFASFQAMVRHDGTDGGGIDYRNGGTYIDISSSIADAGEWHTYAFEMDYDAQTYNLYIDENLHASDISFRLTGQDYSSAFRMLGGSQVSSVGALVDNIGQGLEEEKVELRPALYIIK